MSEEEDIWKTEKRIVSSVKNIVERIAYPLFDFIKKYSLAIGVVLVLSGIPFLALTQAPFLRDVKWYWDYETQSHVPGRYFGVVRAQLLAIAVILLLIGLILIWFTITRQNSTGKENSALIRNPSISAGCIKRRFSLTDYSLYSRDTDNGNPKIDPTERFSRVA